MSKFGDLIMGKNKMESFEDFEKEVLNKIEKYKLEKDLNKRNKLERKLRWRLVKFFKELKKLGIEVHLEGKDGKGIIDEWDIKENLSLERIYEIYVIKTLKEINKEIEKRSKKEGKKK